jgi:hypothetical protein
MEFGVPGGYGIECWIALCNAATQPIARIKRNSKLYFLTFRLPLFSCKQGPFRLPGSVGFSSISYSM